MSNDQLPADTEAVAEIPSVRAPDNKRALLLRWAAVALRNSFLAHQSPRPEHFYQMARTILEECEHHRDDDTIVATLKATCASLNRRCDNLRRSIRALQAAHIVALHSLDKQLDLRRVDNRKIGELQFALQKQNERSAADDDDLFARDIYEIYWATEYDENWRDRIPDWEHSKYQAGYKEMAAKLRERGWGR